MRWVMRTGSHTGWEWPGWTELNTSQGQLRLSSYKVREMRLRWFVYGLFIKNNLKISKSLKVGCYRYIVIIKLGNNFTVFFYPLLSQCKLPIQNLFCLPSIVTSGYLRYWFLIRPFSYLTILLWHQQGIFAQRSAAEWIFYLLWTILYKP